MGLLRDLVRRSLLAWHRPRHWYLRPGTIDARIFRHVVIANEYRLPRHFRASDVVLDIGGHTGSFALAALRRGAGRVIVCEPDPANFACLEKNLAPYRDRVECHRVAVWGCDVPGEGLRLTNPLDPRNTGANRTSTGPGLAVPVVPFDDLVDADVRLVKMDCEGAEWPILATSRRLDRITTICGEYHLGDFSDDAASVELLEAHLRRAGFAVEITPDKRSPYPVGWFFGQR